jgi:hypothetical protein
MRRHADSPQADFLFDHVVSVGRSLKRTRLMSINPPPREQRKFVFVRFHPNR